MAVYRPYSTRFIGGTLTTVRAGQNYSVPSGKRAVVRSVTVYQPTGVSQTVYIWIDTSKGPLYLSVTTVSVTSFSRADLHQVAYAGEVIRAIVSTGESQIGVSGYLLND